MQVRIHAHNELWACCCRFLPVVALYESWRVCLPNSLSRVHLPFHRCGTNSSISQEFVLFATKCRESSPLRIADKSCEEMSCHLLPHPILPTSHDHTSLLSLSFDISSPHGHPSSEVPTAPKKRTKKYSPESEVSLSASRPCTDHHVTAWKKDSVSSHKALWENSTRPSFLPRFFSSLLSTQFSLSTSKRYLERRAQLLLIFVPRSSKTFPYLLLLCKLQVRILGNRIEILLL